MEEAALTLCKKKRFWPFLHLQTTPLYFCLSDFILESGLSTLVSLLFSYVIVDGIKNKKFTITGLLAQIGTLMTECSLIPQNSDFLSSRHLFTIVSAYPLLILISYRGYYILVCSLNLESIIILPERNASNI